MEGAAPQLRRKAPFGRVETLAEAQPFRHERKEMARLVSGPVNSHRVTEGSTAQGLLAG